jgi:hypothetical protein
LRGKGASGKIGNESASNATASGMTVIPLKDARSRLRPGAPVRPPAALSGGVPAASRAQAEDAAEDRLRMRQNLAALVVTLGIVVLGTWLIESLRYYSRIQTCIEAGHRNCVPVDHKYQPRPF